MAFRTFKPTDAGDDPEELAKDMFDQRGRDWSETPELDELCKLLSRAGVEHAHGGYGPWHLIEFQSPHGTVKCCIGPGTEGNRKGLLECHCEGWDFGNRGNLTAREAYNTYMTGGW